MGWRRKVAIVTLAGVVGIASVGDVISPLVKIIKGTDTSNSSLVIQKDPQNTLTIDPVEDIATTTAAALGGPQPDDYEALDLTRSPVTTTPSDDSKELDLTQRVREEVDRFVDRLRGDKDLPVKQKTLDEKTAYMQRFAKIYFPATKFLHEGEKIILESGLDLTLDLYNKRGDYQFGQGEFLNAFNAYKKGGAYDRMMLSALKMTNTNDLALAFDYYLSRGDLVSAREVAERTLFTVESTKTAKNMFTMLGDPISDESWVSRAENLEKKGDYFLAFKSYSMGGNRPGKIRTASNLRKMEYLVPAFDEFLDDGDIESAHMVARRIFPLTRFPNATEKRFTTLKDPETIKYWTGTAAYLWNHGKGPRRAYVALTLVGKGESEMGIIARDAFTPNTQN